MTITTTAICRDEVFWRALEVAAAGERLDDLCRRLDRLRPGDPRRRTLSADRFRARAALSFAVERLVDLGADKDAAMSAVLEGRA